MMLMTLSERTGKTLSGTLTLEQGYGNGVKNYLENSRLEPTLAQANVYGTSSSKSLN